MLEDKEAISYLPSPLSPPALFPASGHQSVPAASSRSHLSPGLVAGVDEVGRGCLFGPVVAAAVILPDAAAAELVAAGLKDSKKLTSVGRRRFAEQIQAVAIDYKIGFARVEEIDRLNIFHGSLLAMKRAVMKLKVQPDLCLVDGKWPIPNLPIEQKTLIKGDEISPAIAAASIIAKVWRDDLIMRLALKYPEYDLVGNKGYGTPKHLQALQKYGPSRLHRRSFSPCRSF
ncbi:MAG TPA: ribonuclease HII [Cyanobacteria bacterium UBA11372]|nr:ribonuclease HII [Cyanobacteria bacterium UBA11372]